MKTIIFSCLGLLHKKEIDLFTVSPLGKFCFDYCSLQANNIGSEELCQLAWVKHAITNGLLHFIESISWNFSYRIYRCVSILSKIGNKSINLM
jgi:hypothetical protein